MKKIFILVAMIFLTFLIGCEAGEEGEKYPPKPYDYFEHIEHWDNLNEIGETFTIVYYYSEFCPVCQSIEAEVTGKLAVLQKEYIVILVSEGDIYGQGEEPFEIMSVPALMIYDNSEFVERIIGPKPVINYLNNLLGE